MTFTLLLTALVSVAGAGQSAADTPAPMPGMAAAPASASCAAGPPRLPVELAGWAARTPVIAAKTTAAVGAAGLPLGRGVDASLRQADGVAYAAPPGKPAGPGGRAGLLALQAPSAGVYAIGLSSPAWVDVVDAKGTPVASSTHGHGPPCSGLRKVVDFTLAPGRYVVQLTTGGEPVVGVIAFRR